MSDVEGDVDEPKAKAPPVERNPSSHAEGGLESRTSVRRLVQDIKEVTLDHSLRDHGIYYEHNMDNYMEGHAMVIGPRDTPYEDSFYFFRFAFPANYPYTPPKVHLLNRTQDRVRLNPNLYVDGKVCLSILNTWQGEPWSACQTIRSVLLTLVTVLNEKPLMNEPGIPDSHREHGVYNYVVQYASLHDCLLLPMERLRYGEPLAHEALFSSTMDARFQRACERIGARLALLAGEEPAHETAQLTPETRQHTRARDAVVKRVRLYDITAYVRWGETARLFARAREKAGAR